MGLGARLTYAGGEASRTLWRHKGRAFSALGSITVSLLLLGAFGIVLKNLDRALASLGARVRMVVFLSDGLTDAQRARLETTLRRRPEVEALRYVSKEQAYAEFTRSFSGNRDLLEGIQGNPLPASYVVTLKEEAVRDGGVERLARTISGLPGVDDLEFGQRWVKRFTALVDAVRLIGFVVGGLLILAVLFLIVTNLKLSLYGRREELEILRRIGASRSMIRLPFLCEGAALGAGGVLLALALLGGVFRALRNHLVPAASLFGSPPPVFLSREIMAAGLLGGAVLGVVGSFLATRSFLKES